MANISNSSHIESFSTTRPSFFMRTDYPYWKNKMTWFLQSTNLDLWDVIEDGPHIPSKLENRVMVLIARFFVVYWIKTKFITKLTILEELVPDQKWFLYKLL